MPTAAPPMRRVLSKVDGVRKNVDRVRRAPLPPEPLKTRDRGEVVKISLPSMKNRRFSGKYVSRAVRFTTTSSDSTAPKSGRAAAVTWRFEDGRQKTSKPALWASSPRALFIVVAVYGNRANCCFGRTPGSRICCSADMNRAPVNGSAGHPHCSSM